MNKGDVHRSNGIYFLLDAGRRRYQQRCHDPECCNFRSYWFPLPPLPETPQALMERTEALKDKAESTVKIDSSLEAASARIQWLEVEICWLNAKLAVKEAIISSQQARGGDHENEKDASKGPNPLPSPDPSTECSAWAALLPQQIRNAMAQPASDLGPHSWLHESHVHALLWRSYWKAMNAIGYIPRVNFLAPEQAAMLADRGAHLDDEDGLREVAYAALADGSFDFASSDAALVLLNTSGGSAIVDDGKHWSLLVYRVAGERRAGQPFSLSADHYDSSHGRINTARAQAFNDAARKASKSGILPALRFPTSVTDCACASQRDGHSCGCFAGDAFAQAAILNTSAPSGPYDPSEAREALRQLRLHLLAFVVR